MSSTARSIPGLALFGALVLSIAGACLIVGTQAHASTLPVQPAPVVHGCLYQYGPAIAVHIGCTVN